jgi:hypothetical protein
MFSSIEINLEYYLIHLSFELIYSYCIRLILILFIIQ